MILLLVQGPIHAGTRQMIARAHRSPARDRLVLVCAVWDDEPEAARAALLAAGADRVISCSKPPRAGSCHRNYQTTAVTQALQACRDLGCAHVLKTRSDVLLSDAFLSRIAHLAGSDFNRVLATNVFTRLESFHVSDMVLFSTWENIAAWFDARPVFYEDLFAPEVQFARVFVRNKGLNYPHQMAAYLRFLRDWIVLVDFNAEGLIWLKQPQLSVRAYNRTNPLSADRDVGPILTRLVTLRLHRFLCRAPGPALALLATWLRLGDALGRLVVPRLRFVPHHFYTMDNQISERAKPVPS